MSSRSGQVSRWSSASTTSSPCSRQPSRLKRSLAQVSSAKTFERETTSALGAFASGIGAYLLKMVDRDHDPGILQRAIALDKFQVEHLRV